MRVMRWLCILALVGVILPVNTARALGRTLYVAPTGSDETGDGSLAEPWASPGYASRLLLPGDTLIIQAGRYLLTRFDEDIIVPPSAAAWAPIIIKGADGPRPVLAGGNNLLAAIMLDGVNWVRIEHLEITHDSEATGEGGWFRDAISGIDAPNAHIELTDLYIHHIDEFGVDLRDIDQLTIRDCRIEYCGFGALGGPEAEVGGWTNVTIEQSVLSYGGHYYQGGDGSARPYDRPDGFGIESSAGPIVIKDCTVEHNYGDGLDSKAANTTIRRCIVANNSCDGVKLWGGGSRVENTLIYGRGDGDATQTPWSPIVIDAEQAGATFELVNLTVDDALGGNYLMHVQYDRPSVAIDLLLRNCILSGRGASTAAWVAGAVALTADHNLFHMPAMEELLVHGTTNYLSGTLTSLGAGNASADPLFLAPAWGAVGDYHVGYDSWAIDHGSNTGAPARDLDGQLRDGRPDIGAYEQMAPLVQVTLPLILKPL